MRRPKMKITITGSEAIQQQLYECAAWYTNWKLIPGVYPLQRAVDERSGKVSYHATVDAEVESDSFQSLFCGNAIGAAYDTAKNRGKRGQRSVSLTPAMALTDSRVSADDKEYVALLLDAEKQLLFDIEIQVSCIKSCTPDWMHGHAASLATASKLYSDVRCCLARRKYNEEAIASGRSNCIWSEADLRIQIGGTL
jgi:hypothetical protein